MQLPGPTRLLQIAIQPIQVDGQRTAVPGEELGRIGTKRFTLHVQGRCGTMRSASIQAGRKL
jgi:hypothetical protein